jgi:Zn-finger nucleic acid-binding protein
MNCPICNVTLQIADRQGVEIDYCPQCRGVWLDRGELDKIIERSTAVPVAGPRVERVQEINHSQEERHHDDQDYDKYGKRRKKSFLGDFFDF